VKESINSKRTLVAYLDVLGYKNLVKNSSPEQFYDLMEKIFLETRTYLSAVYPDKVETPLEIERQCTAEVINAIKFHLISDTFILYLECDEVISINKKFYEKIDHDYTAVVLFFHIVATFVLIFIQKTGVLLRGGISLGDFYKRPLVDSARLDGDFIFSSALVAAAELEKEAHNPRILIDNDLYQLWKEKKEKFKLKQKNVENAIARDSGGKYFLDFYYLLQSFFQEVWLSEIAQHIRISLKEKKPIKIYKKWIWFRNFHNTRIAFFHKERRDKDLNYLFLRKNLIEDVQRYLRCYFWAEKRTYCQIFQNQK